MNSCLDRLVVGRVGASWDGEDLHLTQTETAILRELLSTMPDELSREELCVRVYGNRTGVKRIDVHVCHLRKRLTGTTICLPLAKRGGGYRLEQGAPKILVCEDCETLARFVACLLRDELGADVILVGSFYEAMEAHALHTFDVLIADVLLPIRAGSSVTACGLRLVEDALTRGVAGAVLLSGEPDFRFDAFGLNVAFLVKPFSVPALLAVARQALRLSASCGTRAACRY